MFIWQYIFLTFQGEVSSLLANAIVLNDTNYLPFDQYGCMNHSDKNTSDDCTF